MQEQGIPESWLDMLAPGSRRLPDVLREDLGATDWEGPVSWEAKASKLPGKASKEEEDASESEGPPEDLCGKERILRYKVGVRSIPHASELLLAYACSLQLWNGVIYAWADDHSRLNGADTSFVQYR
jgi:hypothetical protein